MRKAIGIGLIFMIVWAVFTFFLGTPWPWKLWTAKQDSIAYLEEKYGEPFVVGMPFFWIMDGNFHAQASPKARPDLVFSVGTEQGADGIQDSYMYERKKYELQHDIQRIVAQAFPVEIVDVYVDSYGGIDGTSERITIVLHMQEPLQEISTKLYPLVPQLQAISVESFTFFVGNKQLDLGHDTPQHEKDFHALWQDRE